MQTVQVMYEYDLRLLLRLKRRDKALFSTTTHKQLVYSDSRSCCANLKVVNELQEFESDVRVRSRDMGN